VQLVEQMITANPTLTAIVMVGGWLLFAPEAYQNAVKKEGSGHQDGTLHRRLLRHPGAGAAAGEGGFVSGLVG
jgi:hypothetical protein